MKKTLTPILAITAALLTACFGDEATPPGPVLLEPGSYLAVVTTDYATTAIGVIDRSDGSLVTEEAVSSASDDPGISLPLSGDVALSNDPPPPGMLFVLDRTNNNVTLLETTNMTALAQIPVGQSVMGPWAANPHDALLVNGTRLYVARYEKNPSPSPSSSDFDDGDDVVIIDLTAQKPAEQFRFNTLVDSGFRAAPERIALAGSHAAVTLQHYEGNGFSGAGDGLIAFINVSNETLTDTDTVASGTQLMRVDSLTNCSGMRYLASTDTLYAVCSGLFAAGRATQITQSGVIALAMDDIGSASDSYSVVLEAAQEDIEQPLSAVEIVSDTMGFVLTYGSFSPDESDRLYVFDPSSGDGDPELVFEASGPFQLNAVTWDDAANILYVTDAPFGGPHAVRRFSVGVTIEELDPVNPSPEGGLGPTALGLFEVE